MATEDTEATGIGRRTLIKRGALIGGAMVWTMPAVQSIGGVAHAAPGSPGQYRCFIDVGVQNPPTSVCVRYVSNDQRACEGRPKRGDYAPGPVGDIAFMVDSIVYALTTAGFTPIVGGCTPPS